MERERADARCAPRFDRGRRDNAAERPISAVETKPGSSALAKFDKPSNRKRGSLWAVVTAVVVTTVLYFMFFSSREGERPVTNPGGGVTTGAAPVTGGSTPAQ